MKTLIQKILVGIVVCTLSSNSFAQTYQGNIQIAILFDTSNSMDGLIEQAKSRIWSIVNTMSSLRYNGQIPKIEIALYDYGNDNIVENKDFVRQILPLTGDLDLISQKLFALTTRGGSEFCGAVISHSIKELNWSSNPNDLRIIYIAGNEPFNQGNTNYKDVMKVAVQKNIQVNTIYCGDYQQGITEFWYDGSQLGKGEYSNINSNLVVKHYDTPYDEQIRSYNDSLNRTYYGYGSKGKEKKESQDYEDGNAMKQSVSAITERAVVKSKKVYNNATWDIVDASLNDSLQILKLKEEELPQELKGKNEKEKLAFIESKKKDREKFQKIIQDLSKQRDENIAEQKIKDVKPAADFGEEIKQNVLKNASEKGFEVEKK
ncbi:MAG: vWA domain-containing protein [Bacteroidota bacterium]